ncbi:uncharacterized protein LOC117337865 [Pecten maximus]|uniref:uncharacterized protein LOC117337865 n=1 Tax=Pecten maximus TaxID=6579 RepID=UPI001458ACD3|nr:uncharacterized protein LOC117337865 [Pecten maximus]
MESAWMTITVICIITYNFKVTDSASTRLACDGDYLSLACSDGLSIHILDANFGRTEVAPCAGNTSVTNCMMPGTQDIIIEFCETSYTCKILSSSTVFDDPCPNVTKYLNVTFECVGGTTKETIRIPDLTTTPDVTSVPTPWSVINTDISLPATQDASQGQTTCSCAECWKQSRNQLSSVDLTANPEIVKQLTKNITAELRIDKKTLSSTKRRTTSVRDDRISATFMGYIGVGVLTVVFGLIVFTDVVNIVIPCVLGQRTLLYERDI